MKTLLILSIVLLCFVFTGCKELTYHLKKDDTPVATRKKDFYECKMEAIHASKGGCENTSGWGAIACDDAQNKMLHSLLTECLEVRGYTVTRE